jgi:hypothetical protein
MTGLLLLLPALLLSVGCALTPPPFAPDSALRLFLCDLALSVDASFPEQGRSFVASFSFLYIFCPCIVAPGTVWPSLSHNSTAKRSLVLVAKLLMNLASGVLYGAKEQHMVMANPFIVENKGSMLVLFHELEVSGRSLGLCCFGAAAGLYLRATSHPSHALLHPALSLIVKGPMQARAGGRRAEHEFHQRGRRSGRRACCAAGACTACTSQGCHRTTTGPSRCP